MRACSGSHGSQVRALNYEETSLAAVLSAGHELHINGISHEHSEGATSEQELGLTDCVLVMHRAVTTILMGPLQSDTEHVP